MSRQGRLIRARNVGMQVPAWIDQDITLGMLEDIAKHQCLGAGYLPAINRYEAIDTMEKHGDDLCSWLYQETGEDIPIAGSVSAPDLAIDVVQYAVNLWATQKEDEVRRLIKEVV
jgi:hypothetical protein